MDWQRLVLMTLVEVLKELTRRLGHQDLSDQCAECGAEIKAATDPEQKEG